MKTKKLLSIFLALMMMLSAVPFYASAAVETLSASNVTQWPTLSYNNSDGKMYYGQTLAEGLTINNDEVVLDAAGNQVAGHFEFVDPSLMQSYATNAKANLTFVPDNTDAYTGFKKNRSTVTYNVQKTTLVLADENNPPVAASQIVKGATLSTVEIAGGEVKNPYNATESNAANATWVWVNPDTVVTESGEYEAKVQTVSSYEEFIVKVYVEVESSIEATTIVEAPTATLEYGQSWTELVFEGGKVMAGDTEVSGTFTRKSTSTGKPSAGVFDSVQVIFTPDDLEKYTTCEGIATVTVTKANYKFVDENGEEIVPEFTLPYGSTFDQGGALGVALKNMIKDRALLTGADIIGGLTFEAGDKNTVAPLGTNTYNVLVRPYNSNNSNYNATNLQFVLTIEPATVDIVVRTAIDNNVRTLSVAVKDASGPRPQGTFALYIDGVLLKDGLKIGDKAEWAPTVSKAYDMKVVYTPVENDPCVVEDYTTTSSVRLTRYLTRINTLGSGVENYFGDEVKLLANVPDENFGGWKITDANGNEITLEGAVIEGKNITFTMPDYDITVEAIDKTQSSGDGTTGGIFDGLGDLTQGDSDNPIVNIFNNIIAWFKNIINTIIELFRSIGNNS